MQLKVVSLGIHYWAVLPCSCAWAFQTAWLRTWQVSAVNSPATFWKSAMYQQCDFSLYVCVCTDLCNTSLHVWYQCDPADTMLLFLLTLKAMLSLWVEFLGHEVQTLWWWDRCEYFTFIIKMGHAMSNMHCRETLSILIALVENGVNPEALAAVVKELRREAIALKVRLSWSIWLLKRLFGERECFGATMFAHMFATRLLNGKDDCWPGSSSMAQPLESWLNTTNCCMRRSLYESRVLRSGARSPILAGNWWNKWILSIQSLTPNGSGSARVHDCWAKRHSPAWSDLSKALMLLLHPQSRIWKPF